MLILLVKDDRSIVKALELALRRQGYSVNSVGTGAVAVNSVATDPSEMVILDFVVKVS